MILYKFEFERTHRHEIQQLLGARRSLTKKGKVTVVDDDADGSVERLGIRRERQGQSG